MNPSDKDEERTRRFMIRIDRLALYALLWFSLVLQGCAAVTKSPSLAAAEDILSDNTTGQNEQPEPLTVPTPWPTATTLPDRLLLGLEARWVPAVERALAAIDLPSTVILQPVEPSPELLQEGIVDLLLLPDDQGFPITERALALAVPWTSAWEQVTLEEAQKILIDGSPFAAKVEWSEMLPTMKPLRVAGLHPSQPGYPLMLTWSLHARPGLDLLGAEIATALSQFLADEVVQLTAVGDIVLARGLGDRLQSGEDQYPFAAVEHLLTEAELTIGNLESALGESGAAEEKGYTFMAPPEAAGVLAAAGFDVLSLANNHAMDFGPQTLLRAIELLDDQGIRTVGAGADINQATTPLSFNLAAGRIAFLAFVDVPVEVRGFDTRTWIARDGKPGVAWADPGLMRESIGQARESADFVIVLLHSGYEYVVPPSPPQLHAAQLAIDAGADLVIGHHSHILQGIEFYGNGIILYGLGNFAFEDGGVVESGLMNIWIDSHGVRSLEFIPLVLGEGGRPIPADPLQAESIRASLYQLTRSVDPR